MSLNPAHWATTMLDRSGGRETYPDPARSPGPLGLVVAPTLELVEDGRRDEELIDEALAALDEGLPGGHRLNRLRERQRQQRPQELGIRRSDGAKVYNGRTCCWELVQQVHKEMHEMDLSRGGQLLRCTGCDSLYRLVMRHRSQG